MGINYILNGQQYGTTAKSAPAGATIIPTGTSSADIQKMINPASAQTPHPNSYAGSAGITLTPEQQAGNASYLSQNAPAYAPVPTSITTGNISPSPQIQLPTRPSITDYTGTVMGNNFGLTGNGVVTGPNGSLTYAPTTTATPTETALANNKSLFQSFMDRIKTPTKTADIYAEEYANNGIQQKQQDVQNYVNQINTITAKMQANQLSTTGQGRGIPEAIIGGQQAQIAKEAAIQVLPIQAQLAAAQGNLKLAQDHLDTVFKLKAQDAQAENDFYNKQLSAVYDFATSQEKLQLDALNKKNDQNFQLYRDEQSNLNNYVQSAIASGQAPLAGQITTAMASIPTDSYSPDYQQRFQQAIQKTNSLISQIQPKDKYSVITNPLTGEQSAFDTRTGTFKSFGGGGGSTPSNIPVATQTTNNTKPVIQGDTVVHPPTGNIVVDTAQQLVDGNTVPTLIPKRGVQYNAILAKANELSIAQTGKPYSVVDASAAYNFRKSSAYTKFIANAPVAISTINTIVNDVHALQDSGFNMNNIDLFNNYKLKLTAQGLNPLASDTQRATAKELINTLGSISADDIGLLLGSGSGSDYKTKLGGAIFDVSGNLMSTDRISQTVKDRIQAKLNDYYRIAGVKDPSIYSTKDTQAITDPLISGSSNNISQTVKSNGQDYIVGKVYNDGTANWTVDINGKWTKL